MRRVLPRSRYASGMNTVMVGRFVIVVRAAAVMLLASFFAAPRGDAAGADPWKLLTVFEEDPASVGVGRLIPDVTFQTLENKESSLGVLLKDSRALVLCVTSATCPLCMRYAPRQSKMADEFAKHGIAWLMVNVSDSDNRSDMHAQVRTLRWKHAYTPDQGMALRRALRPRTTTEVYVLDAGRTLVYRGAVDDQFGVGTALDAPRHEYLRDALTAVLEGRKVETPAVWSPGCTVDPPEQEDQGESAPRAGGGGDAPAVTYHNQVARILSDRCVECHRNGGPGPFSLETYSSVVSRASMLGTVLRAGLMPPWGAEAPRAGSISPWRHDLSMPDAERQTLLDWLDSERAVGDPRDAPVARAYLSGWTLGSPDALLISPDVDIPPAGPMVQQSVVMTTRQKQDTWLSSVEVLPRTRKAVHHVMLYLLPPPDGGPMLAEPRDECSDLIGTFGPAWSGTVFPEGSGMRVPAGAVILAKVYSRPFGDVMKENIRVSLRFHKEPPAREVRNFAVANRELVIPPGARGLVAQARATLEADTTVTAFIPALRSRARGVWYDAMLPDGEGRHLLSVPLYDFRWRTRYELREPLTLPKGTVLRVKVVYDNTSANPNNSDPDREVHWSWDPLDEMLMGIIESVVPRRDAGERPVP